jgi:predicted small integral membrane protein
MLDKDKVAAPVEHKGTRKGFLPIETNTADRVFISIYLFVAISLLWFRFMEPEPIGISIWVSNVLCLLLAIVIIRWG